MKFRWHSSWVLPNLLGTSLITIYYDILWYSIVYNIRWLDSSCCFDSQFGESLTLGVWENSNVFFILMFLFLYSIALKCYFPFFKYWSHPAHFVKLTKVEIYLLRLQHINETSYNCNQFIYLLNIRRLEVKWQTSGDVSVSELWASTRTRR